jgi:hypothetical protein
LFPIFTLFTARATAKLLEAFYDAHAPITCEIDAYGDFLQALGPDATDEVQRIDPGLTGQYARDHANVVKVESTLTATRLALFQHLRDTALHVIACNVVRISYIATFLQCNFLLAHAASQNFTTSVPYPNASSTIAVIPPFRLSWACRATLASMARCT